MFACFGNGFEQGGLPGPIGILARIGSCAVQGNYQFLASINTDSLAEYPRCAKYVIAGEPPKITLAFLGF